MIVTVGCRGVSCNLCRFHDHEVKGRFSLAGAKKKKRCHFFKTKRPEPVKLDLPLFNVPVGE